jgi:hypothetical protein
MDFAMAEALQSLGLPGRPLPTDRQLALSPETVAARLQAAFERTQARRVYMGPLEAGDLPDLRFGPNRVRSCPSTGPQDREPARQNSRRFFPYAVPRRLPAQPWVIIGHSGLSSDERLELATSIFSKTAEHRAAQQAPSPLLNCCEAS